MVHPVEEQGAVREVREQIVQSLVDVLGGEQALLLVQPRVGDGGRGLLPEQAQRPELMLVVDSSSNSVDVEHAEKRVAVDERHRHRARRRLDRPSSRIDDAGDEHRLARLGDSARNTLPETDPRPGCSAGAPNADGPQLSTAVHEHDRAVARLEKLVRALQNGLEHLLEVEDQVHRLGGFEQGGDLAQAVGERRREDTLVH